MINAEEIHSNNPKLVIATDSSLTVPLSQEETEFLNLVNEIGKQNVINFAMNLAPGRNFADNPFNTAKDVITNLYANGGQESIFNITGFNNPSTCMSNNPQDRIMTDY